MRRLPLVLLAIAPSAAWAQSSLEVTLNQGSNTAVVGPNDCGINISVTWTVTPLATCSSLKIWLSTANSCPQEPAATDPVLEQRGPPLSETTRTFNLAVGDLPLFGADAGVSCGAPGQDVTFKLCASVKVIGALNTCDTFVEETTPPTVRYDSTPPPAPTITRADEQDSAIVVTVSIQGDDVASVIVVATDSSGAQAAQVERATPTGSIRLGNLTNGTTYNVTAQARDEAGNLSQTSQPVQATPVLTSGFFRRYLDEGGSEQGGCSSAGGAALGALSVAAGMWLAWRRRRR